MSKFIESWLARAGEALAAEFSLPVDLLPGAALTADAARFTLAAEIAGEWEGSFTVAVDERALADLLPGLETLGLDTGLDTPGLETPGRDTPDLKTPGLEKAAGDPDADAADSTDSNHDAATGRAADEAGPVRAAWQRLFERITVAAVGELSLASGRSCAVARIAPEAGMPGGGPAMGYQLRAGKRLVAIEITDRVAPVLVEAGVRAPSRSQPAAPPAASTAIPAAAGTGAVPAGGMELLLDVELEASLRFGSREMALSDLLALGPGDVIQLDRALADPVDLIIGDKIVARGEVVLVNGNFGLQVTEVAEPRKSLESIRCLF